MNFERNPLSRPIFLDRAAPFSYLPARFQESRKSNGDEESYTHITKTGFARGVVLSHPAPGGYAFEIRLGNVHGRPDRGIGSWSSLRIALLFTAAHTNRHPLAPHPQRSGFHRISHPSRPVFYRSPFAPGRGRFHGQSDRLIYLRFALSNALAKSPPPNPCEGAFWTGRSGLR